MFQNESNARDVAWEAMHLACELADEAGSNVILQLIQAPPTTLSVKTVTESNSLLLLHCILEECAPRMIRVVDDQRPLFEYLARIYRGGSYSLEAQRKLVSLLVECNVSPNVRDSAYVSIIEAQGSKPHAFIFVPEVFLDALGPNALVPLRRLVRAESDPDQFHHAAADALSYLGDNEVAFDLEALRATFRTHDERAVRSLDRYLWRIGVQNPPERLLDYIATVDFRDYRDDRSWAVRRAARRGIDPARIREAILQHARNAANSNDKREKYELPDLKKTGQDLGILREDDLPDVKVYRHEGPP